MRPLGRSVPLIRFLILVLYILFACLYRMFSHLSFFLQFFNTYLLPYSTFPLRIDPLHFQAGCRKRRLNMALAFSCLFCFVYISFGWWMCPFVALGLVFSIPNQEIDLGKCLRNDLFYVGWDVKPQHNQWTLNQCGAYLLLSESLYCHVLSQSLLIHLLFWIILQKFYGDEYREANLQENDNIQKLRQATKLQVFAVIHIHTDEHCYAYEHCHLHTHTHAHV